MRDLFTKPIESLTSDDVRSVIGWPESLLVEFKLELPSREGRGDAWVRGGNIEDYAKRGIFKEVVALANTSGGHAVLGIAETKDKPAAADHVAPVPRCVELAERLERAAQAIDPPIPMLLARGIPTEPDGAGIVLFRVPESRNAPHRSIDKECYKRRGTESVPMSMREITDMTLAIGHRAEIIANRFQRSKEELYAWFSRAPVESGRGITGFRITAVPAGPPFSLPRLFGNVADLKIAGQYIAVVSSESANGTLSTLDVNGRYRITAPDVSSNELPLLRGISKSPRDGRTRFNLYTSGVVELCVGCKLVSDAKLLPLSWIMAWGVNVLRAADYLRTKAGVPDSEYAVELEVFGQKHVNALTLCGIEDDMGRERIGDLQLPILLPQLSFGPLSEASALITTMVGDLYDATGTRYPTLPTIKIDF